MEKSNLKKKASNGKKKGFTLIEVIVAVTIVIILSALSFPKVTAYIDKAKEAKATSMAKQIYTAAMWSYSKEGNTFIATKIAEAVSNTTNIALEDTSVTPGASNDPVTINFTSDSQDYVLSIYKDKNNYDITKGTDSTPFFTSTQ